MTQKALKELLNLAEQGKVQFKKRITDNYDIGCELCAFSNSLNWRSPARFFIFDDRIEIHTPGALPNDMTTEDVKSGVSMPRNSFLFQNAVYLLPYTGAGSGVVRAMETCPEALFSNKENIHEFIVTIPRNSNQEHSETIQEDTKCTKKIPIVLYD